MLHLVLQGRDPAHNLALEEALLRLLPTEHPGWFLLWRNNPCVIVGRHQLTYNEVDLRLAEKENLPVLRRITGGGAVYQDAGNLNFSFIRNCDNNIATDFASCLKPIVAALQKQGISCQSSDRNDLETDGRKFCGTASLRLGKKRLLHGTLLINCNLGQMARMLKPSGQKLAKRGIASVAARVCNLNEYLQAGIEDIVTVLLKTCAPEPGILPEGITGIAEAIASWKYRSPEWNYGALDSFEQHFVANFPWGEIRAEYRLRDGLVSSCRISGDYFSGRDILALERQLTGIKLPFPERLLRTIPWQDYFVGCDDRAMREFFQGHAPDSQLTEREDKAE